MFDGDSDQPLQVQPLVNSTQVSIFAALPLGSLRGVFVVVKSVLMHKGATIL